MKRFLILTLAAVIAVTSLVSPLQAMEPTVRQDAVTERNGRGPDRNRGRGRDRGGRHHSNKGWGWGVGLGALVGGAIAYGIASSENNAPPRQPVMVYDPACNCYYYR